ncbi:hypothetical protein ABZS88_39210 [Streptomyces sp. NPDC005480]|uniref:hypothetical protein n=1 Tax=Streptomyces sp. NPDC005480 TaxID=3154880 RepID=UPI0033A08B28
MDELFIRIEAQPARDTRRRERTRPHRPAPTTPPGNKILDPGVGLVDRDLLTGSKLSRGGREGRATARVPYRDAETRPDPRRADVPDRLCFVSGCLGVLALLSVAGGFLAYALAAGVDEAGDMHL